MQNTMINNKEREALEKVVNAVDEFIKAHEQTTVEQVMKSSKVEKVHILLYMDLVKDLICSAKSVKSLIEESEEKFIETVTDGGQMTLDEVEKRLMTSILMDLVMSK